jgi:hypothetical protein
VAFATNADGRVAAQFFTHQQAREAQEAHEAAARAFVIMLALSVALIVSHLSIRLIRRRNRKRTYQISNGLQSLKSKYQITTRHYSFWTFMGRFLFTCAAMVTLYTALIDFFIEPPWRDAGVHAKLFIGVTLVLGSYLVYKGKLRKFAVAEDVLRLDKRKPILYLRNFAQEDSLAEPSLLSFDLTSVEDKVLGELSSFGPVIGLANITNDIPPTSYAPLTPKDGDWQTDVMKYMVKSSMIMAIIVDSTSLRWEIEQLIKHNQLNKLVIFFPAQDKETMLNCWILLVRILEHASCERDWGNLRSIYIAFLKRIVESEKHKIWCVTFLDSLIPIVYGGYHLSVLAKNMAAMKVNGLGDGHMEVSYRPE